MGRGSCRAARTSAPAQKDDERDAPWLVDRLPVLGARGVPDRVADHHDRVHRRALRVPRGRRADPREQHDERRDRRHGDTVAEEQADAVAGRERVYEDRAQNSDAVREER